MFNKISLFFCWSASLLFSEEVYLKTPRIDREEIIGMNVGIRPFRKTGVRLEPEKLQDKLIVHNYGYGGSGLTLCFGGSCEVLEILEKQNHAAKSVAVLGGGVAGLASAYDLLEKGYEVHIYADAWSPYLTSDVAGGVWTPYFDGPDIPLEKTKFHQKMLESSEKRFLKSTALEPEFAGIKLIDGYFLNDSNQVDEVTVHFDNGVTKTGKKIHQLALDGKLFMADLFAKVQRKGAKLHTLHLKSLDDVLKLKESIIINCTSMGSQTLFNDQELIPVRGQIVYFPAQGGDYFLLQKMEAPYFFLLTPWSDRLILGGVFEYGESDPVVSLEVIDQIIKNAKECLHL